jgi:PTH1 family peptidyl-tRNA hydrolase
MNRITTLYKSFFTSDDATTEPMLLIAWLGNPWNEYDNTRHNAGFLVVDALREERMGSEWKRHKDSKSLVSECRLWSQKILLIKPQTYMNRSWLSIWYWTRFYKIDTSDILVIHDDIDLPPQRLKLKKWGSSWWQNGIKDAIAKLWTQDFWRLKCGIWRPINPKFAVHDYVLGKMEWDELWFRHDSTDKFIEKVEEWMRNK